MGTGLREPLHADWGQDEDEWVGVDNHASARQAWRSPEARKVGETRPPPFSPSLSRIVTLTNKILLVIFVIST